MIDFFPSEKADKRSDYLFETSETGPVRDGAVVGIYVTVSYLFSGLILILSSINNQLAHLHLLFLILCYRLCTI